MARERLTARNQKKTEESIDWTLPIVDLIPRLNPSFSRPGHMEPFAAKLDEACAQDEESGEVFHAICAATPPQHSKSTVVFFALLKACNTFRGRSHLYATYAQRFTDVQESVCRKIFESAGVKIEGTRESWYLPESDSRITWTSIGGTGTGIPVTGLLIIDDPFKDFEAARSPTIRNTVWEWITGVAIARVHRTTWIVLVATRWHEDDSTGRATDLKEYSWPYINLQAICEDVNDGTGRRLGEALWPQKHPLSSLRVKKSMAPVTFEAQYMGRPRNIGDALFEEPQRFTDLPKQSFTTAYGMDLAYSEKTAADWSVMLKGRRIGNQVFIIGCVRKQLETDKFLPFAKVMYDSEKAPVRWYIAGTEKGTGSLMRKDLPYLEVIPTTRDKVMRSVNIRNGWNLNHVLLPNEESPYYGPWVDDFRKEALAFSGQGDKHDDFIDAVSALVDRLMGSAFNWEDVDGMNDALKSKRPVRGEFNAGGWAKR